MIKKNQSQLEIIDQNGQKHQVEVVMAFVSEKTDQQYVVYTKNEKKENGLVLLYASVMEEKNGKVVFENISDEEWNLVKDQMREVVRQEGVNHG